MKQFFIFLISAVLGCGIMAAEPAVLKTGSKLTSLPSKRYLDETERDFSAFLGKKKLVVVHIWEMGQPALSEFYPLANIAGTLRNDVQFVGIGIGDHNQLKRFPGAVRLGFPVNSDPVGAAGKLLVRPGDQLPLCVILDKEGTILWRGPFRQLPPVLRKCLNGKFDLAEQIRVEEFSASVNQAVKDNDLEKAIRLIDEEYRKYPAKINLLAAQASLYQKLKRMDDAFRILHEAQRRTPGNYRIFEIEYRLIGENELTERLPDFFERLKKNFSKKPDILMAFAVAECKLPPDKLQLKYAFDLAETGWKSNSFKNKEELGMYALDYASILHSIGRNDLAVKAARIACENLKSGSKPHTKAKEALLYYSKLNDIAPTVKLHDLKK